MRILERDEHRLCPPVFRPGALKLLNACALSSNPTLSKGRPVLYLSEVSKQHFLIHARQHSGNRWSVVSIGCWFSRWPSGTFERSAIERSGVEFTNGEQPGARLRKKAES
jgi:hypothetical protein